MYRAGGGLLQTFKDSLWIERVETAFAPSRENVSSCECSCFCWTILGRKMLLADGVYSSSFHSLNIVAVGYLQRSEDCYITGACVMYERAVDTV